MTIPIKFELENTRVHPNAILVTVSRVKMKFKIGISLLVAQLLLSCENQDNIVREGSTQGDNLDSKVESRNKTKAADRGNSTGARPPGMSSGVARKSAEEVLNSIIAEVSENDLENAFTQAVRSYPPDQWKEMLEFISILPMGKKSNAAISAAIYKISTENPTTWLYNQDDLNAYLTKTQLRAAAFDFGKSLSKNGYLEQALRLAVSDEVVLRSEANSEFLQGLYSKIGGDDISVALSYLHQLSGSDKTLILEANREPLKEQIIKSDSGKKLIDSASPDAQPKMAEIIGNVYAGKYADSFQIETEAERVAGDKASRFIIGYFDGLASNDLNSALSRLATIQNQDNKDEVIIDLFPRIYEFDPGAALLWAQEVRNENSRADLIKRLEKLNVAE